MYIARTNIKYFISVEMAARQRREGTSKRQTIRAANAEEISVMYHQIMSRGAEDGSRTKSFLTLALGNCTVTKNELCSQNQRKS